jgi:large subunit ribosomal protein L31e
MVLAENELERIYTIPLRDVKHGSRNKMTNRAVREVRSFLTRHMKSEDIWIDDAVNRAIWANGMYKVPSKLRVRAVRFQDGVVEVSLPEEERSDSIRAQLKEERESKAPILPAAPAEAEEETTEAGEIEAEPETARTTADEADDEAPAGSEDAKPDIHPKETRSKPGDQS